MKQKERNSTAFWEHAGGKLLDEGPESLSDAELLAILIGTGIRGHSAEDIANEIVHRFGSLFGLMGHPLDKLLEIKGLGDARVIRIAAAFEMARRITEKELSAYEETRQSERA